jgi:hypothetical protein
LDTWYNEATRLYDTVTGEAALKCMEPELNILLKAESLGHIAMTVHITPDHLNQLHRFRFELDQSYLPAFHCDRHPHCHHAPHTYNSD